MRGLLEALILAAHVDIDLSGNLTAGDLLVGAGTLLLAAFTWRLARQTRNLARGSEADVRAQWRPVLIADYPPAALTVERRERDASAAVSLMVKNVGRGPAVNVSWMMSSESSTGGLETSERHSLGTVPSQAGWQQEVRAEGMLHRADLEGPQSRVVYTVEMTYDDLSGRTYTTVLSFEDFERESPDSPFPGRVALTQTKFGVEGGP